MELIRNFLSCIGFPSVYCPCGWKGSEFAPLHPDSPPTKPKIRCPKCLGVERHRLYLLYFKKFLPKDRPIRLLHVAPELSLIQYFRSYPNIEYVSIDLAEGSAMFVEDVTALSFADDSFDMIFCSHVLEHIENDSAAMKELCRVLKPKGAAYLQVPLEDMPVTYEDFSITDPLLRKKHFGQEDHVRKYGHDYKDRLETAGFHVELDRFYETLSPRMRKRYGLKKEDLYVCTKEKMAEREGFEPSNP